MSGSDTDTTTGDEECWIKQPTEKFHGLRVVDHEGTVFIEQVDNDGEERQSIMVNPEEVGKLSDALTEIVGTDE